MTVDLQSLVGRTILEVKDDDGHPELVLDDGRVVRFEGVGYDGLWTDVVCQVVERDEGRRG